MFSPGLIVRRSLGVGAEGAAAGVGAGGAVSAAVVEVEVEVDVVTVVRFRFLEGGAAPSSSPEGCFLVLANCIRRWNARGVSSV